MTTQSFFKKAAKSNTKLRLLLSGPSGSGKTYTALQVARHLAGSSGRVVVIDSERGSASKYASDFRKIGMEYDTCDLLEVFGDTSPTAYITAINAAEKEGYSVIIVDSISHEWVGPGGALEMKDEATGPGGNSYTAWRDVTPVHNRFISALVGVKSHLIGCARAKMEYAIEPNEKGKMTPRKVGMAPIQREGVDFEFDVVLDLNPGLKGGSRAKVVKTRYSAINGAEFSNIGSSDNDQFIAATMEFLRDDYSGDETPTNNSMAERSITSPYLAGLTWANSAPRLTANNKAMIANQYASWVKRYQPEYQLPDPKISPQAKLDEFRKWLEARHSDFIKNSGSENETAPDSPPWEPGETDTIEPPAS